MFFFVMLRTNMFLHFVFFWRVHVPLRVSSTRMAKRRYVVCHEYRRLVCDHKACMSRML